MTHLKKYWYWYALGAAAIGALVYFNWDTIKGWFSSDIDRRFQAGSGSGSKQACIRIADGCSYNGLYVPCAECSKRGIAVN